MGEAIVFGQEDTLFRESVDVGISVYIGEVLSALLAEDRRGIASIVLDSPAKW